MRLELPVDSGFLPPKRVDPSLRTLLGSSRNRRSSRISLILHQQSSHRTTIGFYAQEQEQERRVSPKQTKSKRSETNRSARGEEMDASRLETERSGFCWFFFFLFFRLGVGWVGWIGWDGLERVGWDRADGMGGDVAGTEMGRGFCVTRVRCAGFVWGSVGSDGGGEMRKR